MNNDELKQLQTELGLSDQETRQIAADLKQADNLLNTFPVEPLSFELTNDITNRINSRLQRRSPMLWLRRVAAVVVMTLAGLSVWHISSDQQTQIPSVITTTIEQQNQDADRQLWEFALTLDDQRAFESSQAIDTETMTDLLLLFDDADLSADNQVGKEVAWPLTLAIM
jgi:hypothetical protein